MALPTIVLVSCAKSKLPHAATARELYTSALFRGMRAYAERKGDAWFILSAKHGLVSPRTTLAPYERTLVRMSKFERLAWADRVRLRLKRVLPPPPARIVVLAGDKYRSGLVPWLEERGYVVDVPLKRLGLGKQLAWFARFNASGL